MKIRNSLLTLGFVSSIAAAASDASPTLPFVKPEKKVIAHYMTCFSADSPFYHREIQLARRYGLDGFALNCGEWLIPEPGKEPRVTRYVLNADRIFEEARKISPDFKLVMSPDFAGSLISKRADLNVTDMFRRYKDHPNLLRHNNYPVLSGYAGRTENYAVPAGILRKEGHQFYLVPQPSLPGHPMTWSFESTMEFFRPGTPFDGIFNFACDGTVKDLIDKNAMGKRVATKFDKIFMAGVPPAYNSPNLRDFRGVEGYSAIWEGIINDGADWVEIVTWNDYNEDSHLMPYRWRPGGGKNAATLKNLNNRDESCLDVTSYFIRHFKSGRQPEITQDRLYLSYRNRLRTQTRVWNRKENQWVDLRDKKWPYEQIHDDVVDMVNITILLTAPAELTVMQKEVKQQFTLKTGRNFVELPLQPGVPRAILTRGGKPLFDVVGRREIVEKLTETNSPSEEREAFRTWISGTVAGEAEFRFDAKNTELGNKANQTLEFPLKGVRDVTYNVRITYRNASGEARFTLYADGAPGWDKEFPHYLPAWLPPTGGEERTVSFLWSFWKEATLLRLCNDQSDDPKLIANGFNDYGKAQIVRLELIPVEPFRDAPECPDYPELTAIPGGTFRMGSDKGEPDETLVREVTVSPFYIGKYEITNAEFEALFPEHRAKRDGFSWRDREPVIYVSWFDAARYCNALSLKHNLTPAYDEKSWVLNREANGFRLPSEAEWEFVASGRGENRLYPWGDATPAADKGNFSFDELSIRSLRRAGEAAGCTVVGSFPAGASRDGVLDLAGNVAEWVSDTYLINYPNQAETDPHSDAASHHRSIRGGSWGYYNHSQRVADREFNNPGYPGYIYIGFRVALPEAGFAKLNRK